jgi:hypothetical protein
VLAVRPRLVLSAALQPGAADVENVDLFSIDAHQRLRGSYHDAAVSTNEQRDMPRLL